MRVFRLLLEYGSSGALPGKIADELGMPANTLSFHLAHMSRAGLVRSEKNGRSISYFANSDLISTLIEFLQENCCVREKGEKTKSCKGRKC